MIINCPQRSWDSDYTTFTFPAGELQLTLTRKTLITANHTSEENAVDIIFEFKGSSSIWELILLVHTLNINFINIRNLHIPYMPFGQQDRVNNLGECFSLQIFTRIVNSFNAKHVYIYDPHSNVTPALLNNVVVNHQWDIWYKNLCSWKDFVLVSPDAGAEKKTYELAKLLEVHVVNCSKHRNVSTGEITQTIVDCSDFGGKTAVIVDDICVGGATYIAIAKVIRERNAGKIILCVTNGIFSKGLKVFDGLIDEVYTRKHRVL